MKSNNGYEHATVFSGHRGAINALKFYDKGRMLASGADDGTVRLWDIENTSGFDKCVQEVVGGDWGQVLAIEILDAKPGKAGKMFVATARGIVSIIPMAGRTFNLQGASTSEFSDLPIECLSVDEARARVAIASQGGSVEVYTFDHHGLTFLWRATINEDVSSVLFLDERIWIHTLRFGWVQSRDATTGEVIEAYRLSGPPGTVAISSDRTTCAVQNLTEHRFELYRPFAAPRPTILLQSDQCEQARGMMMKAAFAENDRVVVCGSGYGYAKVFDVESGRLLKILSHEDDCTSAETTRNAEICLWKKLTSDALQRLSERRDEERQRRTDEARKKEEQKEANERLRLSEVAARQARRQTIWFVSGTCLMVFAFIAHMYLNEVSEAFSLLRSSIDEHLQNYLPSGGDQFHDSEHKALLVESKRVDLMVVM